MHVNARRAQIITLLTKATTMRVEELISYFNETPATIRRDLTYLEKTGAIMRTHGSVRIVNPFPVRNELFSKEKLAIARCAAQMVKDNSIITLDSGTTILALARQLVNRKGLTVATNSTAIANIFCDSDVTTILAGGELDGPSQAVVGPHADNFFDSIHSSILFFTATGVDMKRGLMTMSPFHTSVKRAMMKNADRRVLLLDPGKFDRLCMINLADFSEVDCLVLAKPLENNEFQKMLEDIGVEIIVADSKDR